MGDWMIIPLGDMPRAYSARYDTREAAEKAAEALAREHWAGMVVAKIVTTFSHELRTTRADEPKGGA